MSELTKEYFDQHIKEKTSKLEKSADMDDRVSKVEADLRKIKEALNIK